MIPLVVCDNEEKRILSILAFDESQKIFREEIFSLRVIFFFFFGCCWPSNVFVLAPHKKKTFIVCIFVADIQKRNTHNIHIIKREF